MTTVILVIHVMLAVALVAVVLLQRSEGGALGIGGGGGMGGLMTGRATANLLSRTTAILAACFMLTSLTLAYLSRLSQEPTSIMQQPAGQQLPATPEVPQSKTPSVPSAPATPSNGATGEQKTPTGPEVPLAQ